jgi:S1-C subfamily serine protease
MATSNSSSALVALSNDLAAAVERAGASVVAVNGRPRTPSTGVIWRDDVVVTTDHTLRQDEDVTITTADDKTLPATIAGRDPATDLALLRVPGLGASSTQFADGKSVRLGHIVLALGRGVTASLGVISSMDGPWRTWRGGAVDQYIRPDVAIYTGFSGGPLVDSQGRIIGINTSGLSRGGAMTVPVATVNRVIDELLSRGRVARGYLGIGMQPVRLPDQVRSALKTENATALIVLSVEAAGPADKAGVLIGDVMVAIDGHHLGDTDDLQAALSGDRIGKPAVLKVLRAGALQDLTVTIGERP